MKRSPPPQRKTPMPRGQKRLSVRSKTNSKPHRDRSAIRDYCETHSMCALCRTRFGEHIHHIFAGRARVDHHANIILLCVHCHGQMHEKPSDGKIRCMNWKQDHDEFDPAALSMIAGEFIVGWLARHEQPAGEIETMRRRLIAVCTGSGD